MSKTLNPHDFVISPEELARNGRGSKTKITKKLKKLIEFYQFPKSVLDGITATGYMPALVVAVVIYETWYYDYEKSNPVRLTTRSLRERGLSREQKQRALRLLEGTGQYIVERSPRRNPLVMMKWVPIKDRGYFR